MGKKHLFSLANEFVGDTALPSALNSWYQIGSILAVAMLSQVITGIFLAMFYVSSVDWAFYSIEYIMRDVAGGWIIRYLHANGASLIFGCVSLHIFRGIYYGSYQSPSVIVWSIGVIIFLLLIMTAFIGYVLPWGQMSFWAATVITNMLTAIPFIGRSIAEWIWGGYSVDAATLTRLFSFHFTLPFLIEGLAAVHLVALHYNGSSNPIGVNSKLDLIPLHPYFAVKDILGFMLTVVLFVYLCVFSPNLVIHVDNYIMATPLLTPAHIVPEWYFLPFYAILRSIPFKLGGVILMLGAIVILLLLPLLNPMPSSSFAVVFRKPMWFLVGNLMILGLLGLAPLASPYLFIGQIATLTYFSYFLLILPLFGLLEATLSLLSRKIWRIFEILVFNLIAVRIDLLAEQQDKSHEMITDSS
jgi:ubiquinol-cytochrome c reductase cytochrome b/c1 subunit